MKSNKPDYTMFDVMVKMAMESGHGPELLPDGIKVCAVNSIKNREPVGLRFIENTELNEDPMSLKENPNPVLFKDKSEKEFVADDGTLWSVHGGILSPYIMRIFPEPHLANISMFRHEE